MIRDFEFFGYKLTFFEIPVVHVHRDGIHLSGFFYEKGFCQVTVPPYRDGYRADMIRQEEHIQSALFSLLP